MADVIRFATAEAVAEMVAAQVEGGRGYATRAELLADLAPGAGALARVTNDPTAGHNGLYRKTGVSGSGAWVQESYDRVAQVETDVAGVGLRVTTVETGVAGLTGGATVSAQQLRIWTEAAAYEPTAITRDTAGLVTTATVRWPDGSAGVFTATTINSTYGAIDAYTITHTASGRTVTQAAVTRNSAGAVTTKPTLTVSP